MNLDVPFHKRKQIKLIPPRAWSGSHVGMGHGPWDGLPMPYARNGEASIHHRLTSVGIPRRFL